MSTQITKAKKELATRELARRSQQAFTTYTMPKNKDGSSQFFAGQFHKSYYSVLDEFVKGNIKKLMITVPPQHGKSEGSTRRLPARLIGKDNTLKIAITSYASTQARRFGRDVNRIIDSREYIALYPNTKLPKSKLHDLQSDAIRTSEEFEIIDNEGSATGGDVKLVGRGTAITGNPVDILVIDDLYKDASEGNSPTIRQNCIDWYNTTAESRLHNDSQQLIVFTRWHEEDLIGYLESKEEVRILKSLSEIDPSYDGWYKINYEAIKTGEPTELDPREKGEALWKERHNIDKLTKTKNRDHEYFECLNQGNPESKEGRLYSGFDTYTELPTHNGIYNYTDTADTGQDYLCSINYAKGQDGLLYVVDLIYTQEPMEVTEPATASLLDRWKVSKADIESNNGGRGFSRNVKTKCRGNTVVSWFHQSGNKESRIHTNKALVQEKMRFPHDWHIRFPEFFNHVTRYKKLFSANKHDDAADTLTGIVEKSQESGIMSFSTERLI